ncbi:MAG: YceH family protein [Bacteroidota bacterium]
MDRVLNDEEVRVVGVLIEKQLSTPDYYPMTLNALTQACNQKTNRDPVVQYDESTVDATLTSLQRLRLVGVAGGASSRATKYRHALAEQLGLDVPSLAVLSVLLVRGPQTVGEVRGRTGRLHAFDTLEDAEAVLHALAEREEPLVGEVPRQPGQKETRYAHLLAGVPAVESIAAPAVSAPPSFGERFEALEEEVTTLRTELEALREAFEAFKGQFQ